MTTDALEVRMARLEGAYEQINERLAGVERGLAALRSEVAGGISGLRSELEGEIAGLRSELKREMGELRVTMTAGFEGARRQTQTQFYWTLTFIFGAVLAPLLLEVLR
ncbi:MAG: hypothetical protein QN122_13615 [Armatimonadota bacterium]|nr:hypothetical protein [Armatimonadota bacterium]MDR7492470.1 hypothetical protein [Armatimonadota bacterium]